MNSRGHATLCKEKKKKKKEKNLIHYPSQRIATRDEQMHEETGSSNPVYKYVSIVYTSHVTFTLNRSTQFSSVQDGTYAIGKASMRSTPSLRLSFPTLPLKQFQCSSD